MGVADIRLRRSLLGALLLVAAAALPGCAPYPVYTAPPVSKFDRAWDAAYGAAGEVGVQITSADRGTGVIRGVKDAVEVTLIVRSQADGSAVTEIKATGPQSQQRAVSQALSSAYDRRMGR